MDYNIIWFVLVVVLFTGYAILDGFDLGVGGLHLLAKDDKERRLFLNSIGPVWDGNEVWLVTGGGALFAAFPEVYATVFSGFYLAFMLLLLALIFRATAIEFRSKRESPIWRAIWDISFSVASLLAALLMGVALGNIIWGIDLNETNEFYGGLLDLLHPYPLLTGITTVALFLMHGSIYLVLKTEGETQARIRGWVKYTMIGFFVTYGITTMATLIYAPHMVVRFKENPVLFLLPLAVLLIVANVPREIDRGREFRAFLSSCTAIAGLLALFAVGVFPNLVRSVPELSNSLNIYNAASSQKTLSIMLVIALMGVPLVLAYTASIYYIFRGKVKLDSMSY